jgi:SAM-dependent methyltransferase
LPKSEYDLMYAIQEYFWWYEGMRDITRALFSRLDIRETVNRQILDVGCGTGGNLEFLSSYGDVIGLDLSGNAFMFLALTVPQDAVMADAAVLPFSDESFDLVCSFDVLEYISDDELATSEIFRVLKSGGLAFVRDAAFSWLRSEHDRSSGIQRRYTAASLASTLRQAGFNIVFNTYADFILFPAIAAIRLIREHLLFRKHGHKSDILRSPRLMNGFLYQVMKLEAQLHKILRLPFGVSVISVGKKP